jgi:hypothetical protein
MYSCVSLSNTAGEMGGGRDGMPRQSRIFLITAGGFIAQTILIFPPQRLHFNESAEYTRLMSSDHAYRRSYKPLFILDLDDNEDFFECLQAGNTVVESSVGLAGMICFLNFDEGANSPEYL